MRAILGGEAAAFWTRVRRRDRLPSLGDDTASRVAACGRLGLARPEHLWQVHLENASREHQGDEPAWHLSLSGRVHECDAP